METIEIGGEPICMAAGGLSLARVCQFWSQRHERPQPLFPLWLLSLTRGMHEQRMRVSMCVCVCVCVCVCGGGIALKNMILMKEQCGVMVFFAEG